MLSRNDILETIRMIAQQHLDIRTITMGISLLSSASGIAAISFRSASVMPFCTSAEKPPIKLTPTFLAARSSALANGT